MLRERPFDIYAGQEDVFWPGYFFSRHNPVFLFPYNTLVILPKDNTKRTLAFLTCPGYSFLEKKDRST